MSAKKDIKLIFSFCQSQAKQINEKIKQATEENKDNPDFKISSIITDAELNPLRDAFVEFVDFTKAYMIMANDALYGTILLSLETQIDFGIRSFADLYFKKGNYGIKFNPLFIGNYTFPELSSKVVGEILRLVFDHVSTFNEINSERDQETHNLLEDASNAAINTLIERDIRLYHESDSRHGGTMRVSDDTYTVSDVLSETGIKPKEGEAIEYYYEFIKKFRKKPSQNSASGKSNGCNPSNGTSNSPNAIASPENNEGEHSHNWEGQDAGKAKQEAQNILQSALDSIDSKRRGNIPSSIISQIEKMLAKPEITWKHILRKFVGAVPYPSRKTRRRLNRRQPERADLCGRLPKRKVNIVICIDTSGSMSDSDIAYCMNEVFHIAKANETKITVIECDAQVNRVYVAKKPGDIQPEVCGRGGTCFTPAIEYINSEGKFKDALMIYFTDGFGEYEIPRPRTYRNMWVVLGSESNLSVKNPYGEVKSLKMDGDYQKFIRRR